MATIRLSYAFFTNFNSISANKPSIIPKITPIIAPILLALPWMVGYSRKYALVMAPRP